MNRRSTSMLIRLLSLCLLLFTFSGCAAIGQRLAPHICDCETALACEREDSLEIATAVAQNQVDHAHLRAQDDGELAAGLLLAEDDDADDESDERAAARSAEELAMEPIDPALASARQGLVDEEDRRSFEITFGFLPSEEEALAFRGAFRRHDQSTVAVHIPGDSLRIYREGQLLANMDLDHYLPDAPIDDLAEHRSQVVDIVRGGTVELQIIHASPDDEGITYYIGIYKLIGDRIGTIFHHPIARRDLDGELTRLADLQFLQGRDHRIIEWVPLDADGQIDGDPIYYEWNHWEGVYRIPGPPPTAPNRDEPRS